MWVWSPLWWRALHVKFIFDASNFLLPIITKCLSKDSVDCSLWCRSFWTCMRIRLIRNDFQQIILSLEFWQLKNRGRNGLRPHTWHIWPILTHWGRVTHICVSKLTIIGSDNGLSPGRLQAIIWPNGGILLIESLGSNFSEILIAIKTFSFKKMNLKMSSGKGGNFVSASVC